MLTAAVKQRVIDAVQKYIDIANKHYKPLTPFAMPKIVFEKRGTTAGTAHTPSWTVDFNVVLLMENTETFLARTVPHEVAHLIDMRHVQGTNGYSTGIRYDRFGRPRRMKRDVHGESWQSVMRVFGVKDSTRCHRYDTTNSRVKQRNRYKYQCRCPEGITAGPKHHARIMRGERIWCNRCKTDIKPEMLVGKNTPSIKLPVAIPPINTTPSWKGTMLPEKPTIDTKNMTNREVVQLIVSTTREGTPAKDVIRKIVVETGMTTAGASTYYYAAKKALTVTQAAA